MTGMFIKINTAKIIALSAVACGIGGCGEKVEPEPPNIIFIVSEDNSPFLGCYGDTSASTPNLDRLASRGIVYDNAFANAPVCAPSRSTIITGMYATSLGTQHMRSMNTIPENFRFFPWYLRQAGYYTVNRTKKDYNIPDQEGVWDVDDWWDYSDMLVNREAGQPFFAMYNTWMSHEDKLHGDRSRLESYYKGAAIGGINDAPASDERFGSFNYMHEPGSVIPPPYHPQTPEMMEDWARYYDCMSMMDDEIGELLAAMERDGLLDNTIVFYFSDHGGVLGRSKRFPFESGLKVPFIIKFPEKYNHLSPAGPGNRSDRVISFVDLAPTVLNLAGIEIPGHFQGKPFLGPDSAEEKEYAFGFRGRMDERYDLSRTARNKQFRYIKNYMPHRIWGQRINFLWNAASMQSWEEACENNLCDDIQSRFWQTKPAEELYDVTADPHNVHNLAGDPGFKDILESMRQATDEWIYSTRDKDFIPEGEYLIPLADTNGFDYYNDNNYDLRAILHIADLAIQGDSSNIQELITAMQSPDPVIRYWGATGCCILGKDALTAKEMLLTLGNDPSLNVRIAAAEALYFIGSADESKSILRNVLHEGRDIYSPALEAIRTHALNVIDLMDIDDKVFFKDEITALYNQQDNTYDRRVATYLISQMD